MWQRDCSIMEGICRLEWCEDESDTLHHFQPTTLCTEGENDSSNSRRSFVLLLSSSHWEALFSQPESFKSWGACHRSAGVDVCASKAESDFSLIPLKRENSIKLLSLCPPLVEPLFLSTCRCHYCPPSPLSCLHFYSPSTLSAPMSPLSSPVLCYPTPACPSHPHNHLLPWLATLPPNVQSELSKVVFLFLPLASTAWWRVII